ncbi:MAG: PadR family transcriptional regulator [Pirellulaceae bacterium]
MNAQSSRPTKEYLSGVPELLVLRLLADREMYGYEIVRGIRLRSAEQMSFGEGVVYPLLHAMQKRRLLAIRRETFNGRPRIYYRLTASGHKKLDEKISRWNQVSSAIQAFLDGDPDEQSAN